VKNATSDMHVFIDEFVTKIAEYYGGRKGRPGGMPTGEPEDVLEFIV
jgi:hypothetical protein